MCNLFYNNNWVSFRKSTHIKLIVVFWVKTDTVTKKSFRFIHQIKKNRTFVPCFLTPL